jgi:uncharacterized membrane protein
MMDIELEHRNAVCWLIPLAAFVSLIIWILFLVESATPRTPGTGHVHLAAGSVPSKSVVAFGRASIAGSTLH